jgi:dinuclear metal center YbgI/SA1388 family protein
MTVCRTSLIDYLNDLLNIYKFNDYCLNGLQLEGRKKISKIVTGVSVCKDLFDAAIKYDADLILVHHGLFWFKQPMCLVGVQQKRVKQLIEADINLAAYHLPLDAHHRVGNNVQLANVLSAKVIGQLDNRIPSIGVVVELPEALTQESLAYILEKKLQRKPAVWGKDDKLIKTIGICTGAAQHDFNFAIELNLDAYITGEVSEFVPHLAKESGVRYFGAGHYATETLGVVALGELLADKFNIEHKFINIENVV